jgi:hypothetical protein
MRRTRGDAARACQTSTIPSSAARSARCASAGASLQGSTAAPEALHRSGPRARSGTTRWRAREATTPSPHHAIGCAAHPPRLFLPPGHGLAPRDTRRNSLIAQYTSGIVRGADRRCIAGALAAFRLAACRIARRRDPLHSRRPGRDDGGILSPSDHMERSPIGLTVSSSTPTMASVIARPVVHGRGLPQGADTRHAIRPLSPRLLD